MATFLIKYTEKATAFFGVEADTQEEAIQRFDEWRINSEDVFYTISKADMESEIEVQIDGQEAWLGNLDEEDILTEEDYQNL